VEHKVWYLEVNSDWSVALLRRSIEVKRKARVLGCRLWITEYGVQELTQGSSKIIPVKVDI